MEDRPTDVPPPAFTPPAASVPPTPPPVAPIPWEDPARPKLAGFFETIQLLYARTREAFQRMPLTSDVLQPYLFGILVAWIGTCFNVMWQMSLRGMMQGLMHAQGQDQDLSFLQTFMAGPVTLALAPAIAAVCILLGALIDHLFLMILGGAKGGFAATLRVVCYAQAATLLTIVPACGGLFAAVVGILFVVVGFSTVHRISNGRAAAAVLLPSVLCCVCVAVIIGMFGATWMAAMKHAMGR